MTYPEDVHTIPVLLVSYFPVKRGWVDREVTGDVSAPLDTVRQHTIRTTEKVIRSLEAGSVYRGYKDLTSRPSLCYRIMGTAAWRLAWWWRSLS